MTRPVKWGGAYAARLVAATLAEYGTTCHLCGAEGATSADHLIPRSRGGPDTLDNLRPAHLSCNKRRGDMTLDEWRAVNDSATTGFVVVIGPPGAGKTTHVHAQARRGDLVIDLDALAVALQPPGADTHDHTARVLAVAQAARHAAIRAADRARAAGRVWIIDTHPPPERMAEYDQRGWRVVVVDPGHDTTVARARAAGRPPRALSAIERWYRHPPVVDRHQTHTPTKSSLSQLNPSRNW